MKILKTKSLIGLEKQVFLKKALIFGFTVLAILAIMGCSKNNATGNTVADAGDYVRIPLSEVANTAEFYTYKDGGVNINYFAVLGSDGKPRVAFDACDVCGGYQGYEQVGSDIRCKKCDRVFSIDGLGTKNKGYGCWPSYLPHEVNNNEILIKVSDLKAGKQRFV